MNRIERPFVLPGSILDFLVVVWLDRRADGGGTRDWLRSHGVLDPTKEELSYFGRRIRRALVLRGVVVAVLFAGLVAFFWYTRSPLLDWIR